MLKRKTNWKQPLFQSRCVSSVCACGSDTVAVVHTGVNGQEIMSKA